MIDRYACYFEVLIPSLLATVYGFAVILRNYKGLYFSMGVLAVVCLMVGQLADCAAVLSGHTEIRAFRIGSLGAVGSGLFFLTANMGPMNSLADDSSPKMKKYRRLALLGPAAAVLLYGGCVVLMARQGCFVGLVSGLILTGITGSSLYYSTKMALIPDVENGFVDCLRPYNGMITLLGLLNTLERGLRNLWQESSLLQTALPFLLYGAIGLCSLLAVLFLKRGAERWENT